MCDCGCGVCVCVYVWVGECWVVVIVVCGGESVGVLRRFVWRSLGVGMGVLGVCE